MPESEMRRSLVPEGDSLDALSRPTGPSLQVKAGSRLGVWGLVVGLGTMTAGTLGAPISLSIAISVMGGGVLVSGFGTLLAATGALRVTGPLPKFVRAAALAGLPLGAVLSLLGITTLTQWGPLVAVVNALTPAAGILGALVVVLLVLGFVLGVPGSDEEPPTA